MPNNQWVLMTETLTECCQLSKRVASLMKKAVTLSAGHVLQILFQEWESRLLPNHLCSEASSDLEVTEGTWEYGELDKSSIFEQQKGYAN